MPGTGSPTDAGRQPARAGQARRSGLQRLGSRAIFTTASTASRRSPTSVYVYGGLSSITSGSTGQELFTDQTRGYTFFEDAYVGIVGGTTDEKGNRLAFNVSAGRQRFTLANAFLIANTAANGWDRAALQANARWASDLLVLGQVAYNDTKFEAFYVDPDEIAGHRHAQTELAVSMSKPVPSTA